MKCVLSPKLPFVMVMVGESGCSHMLTWTHQYGGKWDTSKVVVVVRQ